MSRFQKSIDGLSAVPHKKIKRAFRRNHPFVIPVVTFFMLLVISCFLFIAFGGETIGPSDRKVVHLYYEGKNQDVPTRAKTVGELLENLQISLQAQDLVEPPLATPITSDNLHINVYRSRPVTVVDSNGDKAFKRLATRNPSEIAKSLGFKLYPEDNVYAAPPDEALKDDIVGEKIVIDRATPVTLNLYGKSVLVRTHAQTVKQLLDEKGVKSIAGDSVFPMLSTPIKPNLSIFVVRPGKQVVSREEAVEQPEKIIDDPSKDSSYSDILDPGKPGKRVVIYEIEKKHGKEISRREIQSLISVQPLPRVKVVGTKIDNNFEGGFEAALASLRSCEGSYNSNTGNGYYGAYQFNQGSWDANAPSSYRGKRASDAPPAVQDLAASTYYQKSGWSPWPACSVKLGLPDIYR